MSKSNVDLVITCGNAGDVRKALSASKLLGIHRLHVEQDIYNPIEMVAFANIVTAPSDEYKLFLEEKYSLNNVFNIGGYPMVVLLIKNNYCLVKKFIISIPVLMNMLLLHWVGIYDILILKRLIQLFLT